MNDDINWTPSKEDVQKQEQTIKKGLNLDPDFQSDQIEDRRGEPPYQPSLWEKLKKAYPFPGKK